MRDRMCPVFKHIFLYSNSQNKRSFSDVARLRLEVKKRPFFGFNPCFANRIRRIRSLQIRGTIYEVIESCRIVTYRGQNFRFAHYTGATILEPWIRSSFIGSIAVSRHRERKTCSRSSERGNSFGFSRQRRRATEEYPHTPDGANFNFLVLRTEYA